MRSFGPWRSAISASGRPSSACTSRTSCARGGVILVRAVGEVEPRRVHPGLDERRAASSSDEQAARWWRRSWFGASAPEATSVLRSASAAARGNAAQPGYTAASPSSSSIRSSWLYFATRRGAPGRPS